MYYLTFIFGSIFNGLFFLSYSYPFDPSATMDNMIGFNGVIFRVLCTSMYIVDEWEGGMLIKP